MPEVRDIPLGLIDAPEHVLGFDDRYEQLDELAADIRENGLLYPLIVHVSGERYTLRDGMRRWHACRQLNLAEVRCIVHGESDPPAEAVKLKANLLRENNTDAEIAWWLGELAPKVNHEIARLKEIVGRSESWINDRLDLLRGDPEVLQALAARDISFSQARVLNRVKSDGLRREGLRYAVSDNIPARKLQEWAQRNDGGQPEGAALTAPPPQLAQNGTEATPGIVCHFCGGHKDPANMENIWVHRWHLEMLHKMLSGGEA